MDEKKLMIFLQRILEINRGSNSVSALEQLREILIEHGISKELISLVNTTIDSLPEAKEIARREMISKKNIAIAKRRADARRAREAEMNMYRGCR